MALDGNDSASRVIVRPNEIQDQLSRPRARVAATKVVGTLSGETERGAISCVALVRPLHRRMRDTTVHL
jgi:hypothetical protein